MRETKIDRSVNLWRTLDAIPLPAGWVNVYEINGTKRATPCPAMLRQENDEISCVYSDGSLRTRKTDPPREIRIVPAEFDCGQLEDVSEISNYVGTFHESELDELP